MLAAAPQLASVEALVTIGAPATASHVRHLLSPAQEELANTGEAEVTIGNRSFRVKRQLLEDLERYGDAAHLRDLKRALLVMHSPVDQVVNIDEAAKIFQAARHPKSFVSLDQADHLLSDREDAEYVAETLVAWASRYLGVSRHPFELSHGTAPSVQDGEVLVTELDRKFLRGLFTASHQAMSDEPTAIGGKDMGPSPYDLLLMALGACTSMTLRMYANHKGLSLDDIQIRLRHGRAYAEDCAECETADRKIERITRVLTLAGDLTDAERERLLQIADRCPVHRTLESEPQIVTTLESSTA